MIAPSGAPQTAPSASPMRVEFAFMVAAIDGPSRPREGVATGWLRRLLAPWLAADTAAAPPPSASEAAWVPIFLRPTKNFTPPDDISTPLVMIGSGTGVAPFRAFLQQRRAMIKAAAAAGLSSPASPSSASAAGAAQQGQKGDAWLYFGCRRRDEDYLYGSELEQFEREGDLTRLRVAFSREGERKLYVQHLMRQDGSALASLIVGRGARIYVCGHGAAMARDVHSALCAVLQAFVGMSEGEANEELRVMAEKGLYVQEVFTEESY